MEYLPLIIFGSLLVSIGFVGSKFSSDFRFFKGDERFSKCFDRILAFFAMCLFAVVVPVFFIALREHSQYSPSSDVFRALVVGLLYGIGIVALPISLGAYVGFRTGYGTFDRSLPRWIRWFSRSIWVPVVTTAGAAACIILAGYIVSWIAEAPCYLKGGDVKYDGVCAYKSADAGKSCKHNEECESKCVTKVYDEFGYESCVSTDDNGYFYSHLNGKCSQYKNWNGCG